MKNNNLKKGFTLIELLVVIAIISVLSGVVLQSLSSTRSKSRDAVRMSDIDQINKAMELYAATPGNSIPSTGGGWRCIGLDDASTCATPEFTFSGFTSLNAALSSSMSKVPKDPLFTSGLGNRYLYNSNTEACILV